MSQDLKLHVSLSYKWKDRLFFSRNNSVRQSCRRSFISIINSATLFDFTKLAFLSHLDVVLLIYAGDLAYKTINESASAPPTFSRLFLCRMGKALFVQLL